MPRTPRSFTRSSRQPLQRRLGLLAMESDSNRRNAAARRVVDLLSDEHLALLAARSTSTDHITMECGVIGKAWGDSRVANRLNQLSRQGISVTRETIKTRFGEAEMVRERLVVSF